MNRLMLATAFTLALPLGACMAQEERRPARTAAAAGQCFNVDSVTSFNPLDADTVDVRLSPRRVYRLELSGGCEDMDLTSRIAIRSRSGGRIICSHLDAELVVPSSLGTRSCFVTGMRALTQDEIQARATRR